MPAWVIIALIRYGLPLILQLARKWGLINMVEAEIIKFGMSLKIEQTYPLDPPGKTNESNING